ncbi:MAG: hypothetical protein AABY22_03130, partial [Nanoarchaeota archaeon]
MKQLFSIFLSCILAVSCFSEQVPVKFFVDPSFLNYQTSTEIQNNLVGYINDLNYVLSKNTYKWLVFSGFVVKTQNNAQFWDGWANNLPNSNYDVWVDIDKSDYPFSYGGYCSFNNTGEAVLADLIWSKFYNPLNPSDLKDYWSQVTVFLHEYA